MKDFTRGIYGVASMCAAVLAGLAVLDMIGGGTLALCAALLGTSVTITDAARRHRHAAQLQFAPVVR